MNKSDSIFQYTEGGLTIQMYRNKKGTKTIGLFLGALLCVFLAGCGCGGGGGNDARTPATTAISPDDVPPIFIEQTINDQNYIEDIPIEPLDLPEAISGNEGRSYSIIGSPPFDLTFDPSTRQLSGTPSGVGTVRVTYRVMDEDDNTRRTDEDTLSFTITVGPDTAPEFALEKTILDQNYIEGIEMLLDLPEATGGNGGLSYSIIGSPPFGLTFNPSTRQLSGRPSGTGELRVTYKVMDGDVNTLATDEDTLTFTINVDPDTAPKFFSETVSGLIHDVYVEGNPILWTLAGATGGNGDLSYSIHPERPFGLSFDTSTLRLDGTPSGTGEVTVTYTVMDEDANTQATDEDSFTFRITVVANSDPFFTDKIPDQVYIQGIPRTPVILLPEAMGGDGELTYSLEPQPDGMIFNSVTRELSGSPTILGTTSVTYTATDRDMDTAELTFKVIFGTPRTKNICGRTPQVRDAILAQIREGDNTITCDTVTDLHLAIITELDLEGTGITSLQADDFDCLVNLQALRLHNNSLTTLPENIFKGLTSLTTLSLSSNDLTSLPENLFEDLSSLTHLIMYNNALTTLPENLFNGTPNIVELRLYSNKLTTLPEGIFAGLTRVRNVDLRKNELENLPEGIFQEGIDSPFGRIDTMRINLSHNRLENLPENIFNGLSRLSRINLSYNRLETLPENIFKGQGLSRLRAVNLNYNNLETIREDLLDEGLPELRGIGLSHNRLETIPANLFKGPPNFDSVDLSWNNLETMPEDLFEGVRMEAIILYHNNLNTLPEDLFEGLENLRKLEIDNNDLTVLPSDVFAGLGNLEELGLNNNGLTTPSANLFNGLSSLTELRLGGNNMANPPENLFNDLSSLTDLTMSYNRITTLPAGLFTPLTSLTDLDIRCNSITTRPAGLSSSLMLDLRGNPIDATPYNCN